MLDLLSKFRCSLCGSESCRNLLTITRPDRFEIALGISRTDYIRHWVECMGCGVALNINSPDNVKLLQSLSTSYYEVDFQSESIADKYRKVMALPMGKSDNAQRVLRIRDFTKRWFNLHTKEMEIPHTVLDIGAGTGVFLSRFIEEFAKESVTWKGVALEPDRSAFEHLRSLGKFDVKEMAFTGQPEFSDYDLCTLNKIVEHIDNPVGFMKNVRNVLSIDRGLLYIEVPDIMTIFYRHFSDNILGSLHYHLYGYRSLSFLLKESDFVLLHMSRLLEPSGKMTIVAFATLPSAFNVLVDSGVVW